MIAPVEATPEARLVELLERGRSIEVIKQAVGWSTFEVRECAAHHGYEFDKEGCPHAVARAASPRRTAPNPAYPVPQPHEALDRPTTGPAFIPSPAPARRVHEKDCGFVDDDHPGPCQVPAFPVIDVDAIAQLNVWTDWLRQAQASTARPVATALRRCQQQLARLAEALDADAAAAAAAAAEAEVRAAALDKLQKAEAALLKARRAAETVGALPAKGSHRSGATKAQTIARARVREWARGNGWPGLPHAGRIPGDVQAAYDLAHSAPPAP